MGMAAANEITQQKQTHVEFLEVHGTYLIEGRKTGKMQVSSANDVKIYSLTSGKSLPEWVEERRRSKTRRRERAYASGAIQLIQDFDMPVVSTRVRISRDARYAVALGTYKPRMKCYDVADLGLKFERCFDSEAVAFDYLSDDYSKLVFLHCDRYVSFHAQFGYYYRLRIPRNGRDLAYLRHACEAHFCGDGKNVYRISLEQGRFLAPYSLEDANAAGGGNVIAHNEVHQLTCVGTASGTVEAWDSRSHRRVGVLDCAGSGSFASKTPGVGQEVTALAFRDQLTFGVGGSAGVVGVYDLRSPTPLLTKDHRYGLPIKKIRFHDSSGHALSMDKKGIKVWDARTGSALTSIESKTELNDFDHFPRSGLIFSACEQPKLQVHYLPALGPAPKWCAFLDNIADELEGSAESTTDVYDNYKFVTRRQLEALELDNLIGTPMLRAYMHGYFVDVRLYRKAQSLAGPAAEATDKTYLEEKVRREMQEKQKRVEARRAKNKPAVNPELFEKLEEEKAKPKKKATKAASVSLLEDDRFKSIFEDKDFAIDTSEEAYKLANPVLSKMKEEKAKKRAGESTDEEEGPEEYDDSGHISDSDSMADDDSDVSEEEEEEAPRRKETKKPEQNNSAPKSFVLQKDDGKSKQKKKDRMSLGSRLSRLEVEEEVSQQSLKRHSDGSVSMTFRGGKNKKAMQQKIRQQKHLEERRQVRRSVSSLKNKKAMKAT